MELKKIFQQGRIINPAVPDRITVTITAKPQTGEMNVTSIPPISYHIMARMLLQAADAAVVEIAKIDSMLVNKKKEGAADGEKENSDNRGN